MRVKDEGVGLFHDPFCFIVTNFLSTSFVSVGLITDRITVFLNMGRGVTLCIHVECSIRVVLTSWQIGGNIFVFKVLCCLGVPGIVAVLFVGRASFTVRQQLFILVVDSAREAGPECGVTAE